MSILHDKLPCSNSFFRMRTQFRQKNGLSLHGGAPTAMIASPAMIRKKSNAERAGPGLADKNCISQFDTDSDEDDTPSKNPNRDGGNAPQIGISTLENKRANLGVAALKMPKLKEAGESLQKNQSKFEPPSPLTANKTRVQRHNLKALDTSA
jgi:hypothetical protein